MPKKTEEIDKLACAYLAGREKKLQEDIARILGLSQATVSRLLKEATEEGYIEREIRFVQKDDINESRMAEIQRRISHKDKELEDKLDRIARGSEYKPYPEIRGPILRVFSSEGKDTPTLRWDDRLKEFSRQAAPYVKELLLRPSLCGTSWGLTLHGVISALQDLLVSAPRMSKPIQMIPLSGELLSEMPSSQIRSRFSASNLAARLERLLNGDNANTLSLGSVPAFIPEGFSKSEEAGVRKLIDIVKAHELIFGSPSTRKSSQIPLVDKLDMVLTSMGASDHPLGFGRGSLLPADLVDLQNQNLVLGDIAGVCIPHPKYSKRTPTKLANVNERWTGVGKKHLEACAQRAASSKSEKEHPGVVVVAFGELKAACALEAIKQGLISVLIIDERLKQELEKLVSQESI
jgi:DNA-binding transcriptional regulator LsrR (DeoR family)